MGVGVRHKLISGISISPNHSVRETTLFPEVFNQTLNHSLWEYPQEWLENYHIVRYAFGDASHSETVKSVVKCRFGAAA